MGGEAFVRSGLAGLSWNLVRHLPVTHNGSMIAASTRPMQFLCLVSVLASGGADPLRQKEIPARSVRAFSTACGRTCWPTSRCFFPAGIGPFGCLRDACQQEIQAVTWHGIFNCLPLTTLQFLQLLRSERGGTGETMTIVQWLPSRTMHKTEQHWQEYVG